MRFIKLILVLFVLAGVTQLPAQEDFRKTAPKPGPAPKIQLSAYEQFSLPNGLQVIVVENHKLPRVSFQVFVDVPEALEGDYAGVSSMAGQLLTTGTKTRSKAQIDEAIDFIGASLSGNAKGMFGTALSKHRDQLLELMSDVLFNATFPQEEFDKLKKQTLSGLASQKDDPNAISNNVSSVLLYGKNHPYGELTTEATVSRIGVDQCKEYVRNNFKPNIAYLIIVGDITLADAKKVANTYFGKWVKGDVKKPKLTQPQAPAATQVSFVDKTGAVQSLIDITYPIDFKPGNPENTAASVMNKILGGGSSGRLFKNIREDKGYTYGAYSSISSDELIGNFSASASVRNAVTDSSLVEFMAELNRMRNELVTAEELAFAKAELAGSFGRSLELPQTIASFALNTVRYKLPKDYYNTYLERLDKVTAADVQAMAKKYLHPDRAHIIIVGSKDEVADKLGVFSANKQVNYYDMYGNPVVMKASVMPEGLTAQSVVDNYLAAIGGRDKAAAVKDITFNMSTTVQGMTLQVKNAQKFPAKQLTAVTMNGMVVNEIRFDGEKGQSSAMGQSEKIEGDAAIAMAEQAIIFPELEYANGYQVELKGEEAVNGTDAYKLVITSPAGNKRTEFFAKDTGFKIRVISSQESEGQAITTIQDFSDYREVDGLKLPFKMVTTGAMPFPLDMKVESVEINKDLSDDIFKSGN